jgi:hypothetical protein
MKDSTLAGSTFACLMLGDPLRIKSQKSLIFTDAGPHYTIANRTLTGVRLALKASLTHSLTH